MGELIFQALSRMSHHLPSFSLSLNFPLGFHEIIEITNTSVDSYSLRVGREPILICHFQDEEMEAENGQARSSGRAGQGGGGEGWCRTQAFLTSQPVPIPACLIMYLAYVLVVCFMSKNICT